MQLHLLLHLRLHLLLHLLLLRQLSDHHQESPFLIYGIGIIPPIIMLVELTTIIPLLVRIASTEQKISGDCVNITLRYMKSRRALRALIGRNVSRASIHFK